MMKKLTAMCLGLMTMLLMTGCDAAEIVGMSLTFAGDILSIVD
jgi:hypothetical protein